MKLKIIRVTIKRSILKINRLLLIQEFLKMGDVLFNNRFIWSLKHQKLLKYNES